MDIEEVQRKSLNSEMPGIGRSFKARGQNVSDQKTEGLALELNEKKYTVEKAKGSAGKYNVS